MKARKVIATSICLFVSSFALSAQQSSDILALRENSNNLLLNQRKRNSTIDEVPTQIVDSDYVSIELNNFIEDLTFYYYSLGNNMFLVADLAEIESADSNLKAFKIIINNDYYPQDFSFDCSKLYSELLYEKNGLLTKYYVEVNVNRVIEILKRSIDCSSFEVGEPEFTHILSYINYEKNYYEKKQNYQVNSYSLAFEEGTEDESEPTYKERVNNLINDIDVTDDGAPKFYANYLKHYKRLPSDALNTIKNLKTNYNPVSTTGDDLIVNVIPKELFTFSDVIDPNHDPYGSDDLGYRKFKGGNEWGFFMKTIQVGSDFYSDVILFDVEYKPALIESDSSFTISPILSALYIYSSTQDKVRLETNSLYYIANPEYIDYYSIYKNNNENLSKVEIDNTNRIPASNIYVDFMGHTRMQKKPISLGLGQFLASFISNDFVENLLDTIGLNVFESLVSAGLKLLGASSPAIGLVNLGIETIDNLVNRYLDEKNIEYKENANEDFISDGIHLLYDPTNSETINGNQFIYNEYIEAVNGDVSDTQEGPPEYFYNDYVSYKLEYDNDSPLFLKNNGDKFNVIINRDMHRLLDSSIDTSYIYFFDVNYKLYIYQDSDSVTRSDVEEIINCSFVQRSSNLANGDTVNLELNESAAIFYDCRYSDAARNYQTFEFTADKSSNYKFIFKEVIDVEFNLFEKETNKNILRYHPSDGISGEISDNVKKEKINDQTIFEHINLTYNKKYYIRVTQKQYQITSSSGLTGRYINSPSYGYILVGHESVWKIYPSESMYQLDVDLTKDSYELYQFDADIDDKIAIVTNNDVHRDDNDYWDSSNLIQDPCIFVYDKFMNKIAVEFTSKALLGLDLIMYEAGTFYLKVASRSGEKGKCSVSAISNYHYLTEINGSNTDGLYQVDFTSSAKTKYIQYRSTHEHTVAFTTAGSTGVCIDMKIYNASDDILFYRAFVQGTSEQIFTFGEGEFYKIEFEYVGPIAQGVKISELIYYELK